MADGSIYVVQVGALREHKRPDLAIEAFMLAKSEIPNLKLILAGDGPMRSELEQMVKKHGFNDSVIFLGQCCQIPALLKRCHIGMLLSRNEGLGLVFLEYMAARLPVVTWAMPVIDELVKNDQNGLVVPEPTPGAISQALVKLCRSPELRAKMGKAGREFVTSGQFSVESHVQRIHGILTEIAQRS
jgi:glycosyltransferase involved in cell wall biosynthesis